jgi:hypothetical protein
MAAFEIRKNHEVAAADPISKPPIINKVPQSSKSITAITKDLVKSNAKPAKNSVKNQKEELATNAENVILSSPFWIAVSNSIG